MYTKVYTEVVTVSKKDEGVLKKLLDKIPGRDKDKAVAEPFCFGKEEEQPEDPSLVMEFEGQVTKRGNSLGINLQKEYLAVARIIKGFRTKIALYRPPGSSLWRAQIVFIPPGENENGIDTRPKQ